MIKVTVKLDKAAIANLKAAALKSAEVAMEQVHTDLVSSQTMPFDTGDMQNNQTFVATTQNGATIVTGSPQARRLYYHPEYHFQQGQGKNANAGAGWFEPYVSGEKKDLARDAFIYDFKRRTGV